LLLLLLLVVPVLLLLQALLHAAGGMCRGCGCSLRLLSRVLLLHRVHRYYRRSCLLLMRWWELVLLHRR
jgi:hypothetical protein